MTFSQKLAATGIVLVTTVATVKMVAPNRAALVPKPTSQCQEALKYVAMFKNNPEIVKSIKQQAKECF